MMVECPSCGRAFEQGTYCPVDGAHLAPGAARARRDSMLDQVVGGTFQIEGVLGRGTGGTVYAATQLDLARPVAVKVLSADLARVPRHVARFEREAQALARIEDPGVVAVYAIGRTDDDRPYLAMERVDGVTLEEIAQAGPMPPVRALVLARRIAAALAAVHAAGLVHRDLKPSNVMVMRGDVVKLLDFGVVKLDDATKLTAGGEALGTPHYMAPEQATGDEVDARTDLYSLGAILFRLVVGEVPFEGTGMQVMMAHVGRPVPRLAERAPVTSPVRGARDGRDPLAAIDAIIARCMAKRPAERFESAAALGRALDVAIAELARRLDPRAFDATLPETRARTSMATAATVEAATMASAPARPRPPGKRVETDVRALLPPRPFARVALALLLASIAAAGIAIAAWAVGRSRHPGANAGSAATAVDDGAELAPATAERGPDVVIVGDGYAMRVGLPARLEAGASAEVVLRIWDGDGAPVTGTETVVTIAAPSGAVMGLRASETTKGVYRFRAHFGESGAHVLRVFLPIGDATLTVPLTVARHPPTA